MNRPALIGVALLLAAAAVVAQKPSAPPAAFMLLIHESKDSTVQQATVRDAHEWREVAERSGIAWEVVDQDEAAKRWPMATGAARKTGLPAIVWIAKDGKGKAEKCPDTTAGMILAVKQHRGNR